MLDTLRVISTPEGVELTLRLAGPVSRCLAWLIDVLIRTAIFLAFATVLGSLDRFGAGLAAVLWFLLEWLYPVMFEMLRRGATPGKASMKLRAVMDDGTPITWGASLTRNILRVIDFMPLMYLAGFMSMLISGRFQRLGDLAAGTVVVYSSELAYPNTLPDAPVRTPPVRLLPEEQRAIIDFAQRLPGWTDERADELAAIAEPLIENKPTASPSMQLVGLARFLLGQR
ncbi:putative RDD family membrane protein YckC [Chitinivorax tropicus]|uniref:Putative RDD family membrane protein YckC n=1 Tax=Chitinivorax tropicus TaxID=714531 RepID=A0A840ME32_9PROT|nr:RDD family protein [Chitinivorax tropicus]MBB5016938.1 putative RDD family membrane protein YckC [Chitinivorax tropicus]